MIWKQAAAVAWTGLSIDWHYLALAFVLLLIGQAMQSQLAWITQYFLGYAVDHLSIYRVWFFSQIAKYIPGSLWQVAARTGFYLQRGVPLATASIATIWELAATISGSLIVCLFAFFLRPDGYLVSLSAAALILASLFLFMIWPWRLLANLQIKSAERMIATLTALKQRRYQMLISLLALSVIVWAIIGTGFYFLSRAFGANTELTWWNAAISFNVAYSIGFLVIVAPTGLGVRELVLTVLLAAYFNASTLAVFVLIARLWWISAEGILILIAGMGQLITHRVAILKSEG